MYSTQFCPYCMRAKQLLESKGVAFHDTPVDGRPDLRDQMRRESHLNTVPQIWIGERHVGGFDDLWLLEQRGELDALLAADNNETS